MYFPSHWRIRQSAAMATLTPVAGVLAVTLSDATCEATGQLPVSGIASVMLADVSVSGAGALRYCRVELLLLHLAQRHWQVSVQLSLLVLR